MSPGRGIMEEKVLFYFLNSISIIFKKANNIAKTWFKFNREKSTFRHGSFVEITQSEFTVTEPSHHF